MRPVRRASFSKRFSMDCASRTASIVNSLLYKYSTLLSRFRLLFFLGGESGQQIGLALLWQSCRPEIARRLRKQECTDIASLPFHSLPFHSIPFRFSTNTNQIEECFVAVKCSSREIKGGAENVTSNPLSACADPTLNKSVLTR